MSAKWERSKTWGRAHLRGPLTPLRWVLDALSSIPFGVAMLGVVALWGFLGTIPMGWMFDRLPSDAVLRKHPRLDLTEGEWYRLWPMQLALAFFIVNMIVATVRRIEFRWPNVGVLSVHAGIVLLAVGGWCYSIWKVEGLMLLPMAEGGAYSKREVSWFSDMTEPALLVRREGEADRIIPLEGLPRYASGEFASPVPLDDAGVSVVAYAMSMPVSYHWLLGDGAGGTLPIGVWHVRYLNHLGPAGSAGPWHSALVVAGADPVMIGRAPPRSLRVYMTGNDSDAWWDAMLAGEVTVDADLVLGADQAVVQVSGELPKRFMDIRPGDAWTLGADDRVELLAYEETVRRVEGNPRPRAAAIDRHGGYDYAGVRVSFTDRLGETHSVWVPFSIFGDNTTLIDERTSVSFTLTRHELQGAWVRADSFAVEQRPPEALKRGLHLADDLIADFVVGITTSDARGQTTQTIRLNQPATLRTDPESGAFMGRLASWLGATRFSLSVSGWDEPGLASGRYRYVVLTVGNTPGTDLVALGGVMFALGTPWALFVKPWFVRRRMRAAA